MSEYLSAHIHDSEGSIRDSIARIPELVSRAKEFGMSSLGISNHGTLNSIFKFYKECNKQEIKPVIGFEAYYVTSSEDKSKNYHLCLYAMNNIGLRNLYKLSSDAYINNFYRKPRVTWESLFNYREGVLVTSACMASIFAQNLINGNTDECNTEIDKFKSVFGENFYLELHNHGIPEEVIIRDHFRNYGRENNIKTIAGTDAHMCRIEDLDTHKIFKQLAYGSVGKEADAGFDGDGYHLLSYDEMLSRFNKTEIDTTLEIADKCNVSIKHNEYHLPKFNTNGVDKYDYIKDLAYKGLKRIGKDTDQPYIDRLEYELGIVHMGKLEDYFLITADIIKWCKDSNVAVGPGRGSSGSSLLCYCIGITQLDPLQYNLQFSRMLNSGRLLQMNFLDGV